tara:strand:- start:692 stop:1405 length:714 start_codon:yes stop_codon:yes gene_type:complete
MNILSFDVGIKNLSYVVIEINNGIKDFKIKKWENIDILHNLDNLKLIKAGLKRMSLVDLKFFSNHHNIKVNGKLKKDFIVAINLFMKQNKIRNSKYVASVNELGENLITKLDIILEQLKQSNITIDYVIIENQPKINFQMRTLQIMIFTYFLINKIHRISVECVSPSNKSHFCNSYLEESPDFKTSYNKRKNMSVDVVQKILGSTIHAFPCWKGKKDDLSDVVTQAFGFYSILKKKE